MTDTKGLKFLPVCFRPCVPDHSLGYVHTLKEVELVVSSLERDTCVKFSVYKTQPASFGKVNLTSTSELSRHKLLWEEKKDVTICRIPFDGYPFIVIGKKIFDCHLGPKRKPHKKAPSQVPSEDHVYEVSNRKRMRISHTKKLDCPAKIIVREIIKFHNVQISNDDLSQKDKIDQYSAFMKKNIAEGQASYERVFFMHLPIASDHKNHAVGEAAQLLFHINPAISSEIQLRVSEVVKDHLGRNSTQDCKIGIVESKHPEDASAGTNTTAVNEGQTSTVSKSAAYKCRETLKKLTSLTYIVTDEGAINSLLKSLRNSLSRFEKFVPNDATKYLPAFFTPCLPGGSLGFVRTPDEVELVIAALEHSSSVKYAVYKSTPMSFGKTDGPTKADLEKHKLFWEDRKDVISCRVPFDGYPFMVIGKKVYECHFGPDRKKIQKEKRRSAQQEEMLNSEPKPGEKRKRTRFQHTKKLDCPARLVVREIIKFHDFQIKQADLSKKKKLDWYSTCTRKNIADESAIYERLFFMHLPTVSDHKYHAVGAAEGLPLNTDPTLSSEMRTEIQTCVSECVKDLGKIATAQDTQTVSSYVRNNLSESTQTPIYEVTQYEQCNVAQNPQTVTLEIDPQTGRPIKQDVQTITLEVTPHDVTNQQQNTQIVTTEVISHIQRNTAQNSQTVLPLEVNQPIVIYESQAVNSAQNPHQIIYEGQHVNVQNQHVIYESQLVDNTPISHAVSYEGQPLNNSTCLDISQSTWQTIGAGNILTSTENQPRIEISFEPNEASMIPHPTGVHVGPGGDNIAQQ